MVVILYDLCYNQNSCFDYKIKDTKKGKVPVMEIKEILDLYSKEEHSGFSEEEIVQAEEYIGVALPQILIGARRRLGMWQNILQRK